MPKSVEPVTGATHERRTTALDVVAQMQQRRAEQAELDRAKAAQATAAGGTGGTASDVARERKERVRPYRVNLDPETSRLTTEVLDTTTGEVIMRIPMGYVDPDEEKHARDEGRPEREIEA